MSYPLELATLPLEVPVRSCLFSMNTTQQKGNSPVSIILPEITYDPETKFKESFLKTTDSQFPSVLDEGTSGSINIFRDAYYVSM